MSEETKGPRIQRALRQNAADRKRGMTLDELGAFVDEARRQEIPGETTVQMTTTWRRSIKQPEISG